MSRKAARFTQADVARAIRAAKQTGAGAVLVLPDGTIRIELRSANVTPDKEPQDPAETIIL